MSTPDRLFESLPGGKTRCTACARYCVLPPGARGFCFVRQNVGGRLELLTYGRVAALQVDPVEKKPLAHYRPGTRVLSLGTAGCNWRCQYCQNWQISQEREATGRPLAPEEAVRLALREGCSGVTFTYNEPTIFAEYARDVMRSAHRAGLFTNFVTNGYLSREALEFLRGELDAISIDLKGSGEPGFLRKYVAAKGPGPIFESMETLRRQGVHVEITDLIVPQVGDDPEALRDLARRIVDRLGPQTPLHLLRWHPDYRMLDLPPPPLPTLERLHAIARSAGLQFVYLGNVGPHPLAHTYCPNCGRRVVEREGFALRSWELTGSNACPHCGERIPIVGRPPDRYLPTEPTPIAGPWRAAPRAHGPPRPGR